MVTLTDRERIWRLCVECAESIYGATPPTERYAMATAKLLFGTGCQESGLTWERQRTPRWDGDVGGFSKWQVERGSIQSSLEYLRKRPDVLRRATDWLFRDPKAPVSWIDTMSLDAILWSMRLDDNDKIGLVFCRLHYFRVSAPIPMMLADQAAYWKDYYNTRAGSGTAEQYVASWRRFAPGVVPE